VCGIYHPRASPQSLNVNVVCPRRSMRGRHGSRRLPVMRQLALECRGGGSRVYGLGLRVQNAGCGI
jgi:hypothetical protein